MKTVDAINGIDMHYARTTDHPYGSKGVKTKFKVDDDFLKKLKVAFREVFNHCPLGKPECIATAGIFVNKPGQHGVGKAFDLDAIFWKDHTLITLDFVHQKALYLGVESFLRKHFGIVLNHFYDNHEDHWHIGTSTNVDYHEAAQSETFYLQMALKYIYDKPIIIDGVSGPQTRSFTKNVFNRLNIKTPITTKVNYLEFLDITGKIAFKLSEEKVSPLVLIENLESVIENLPTANKHKVSEALNTFLIHNDTSNWLSSVSTEHDLDAVIDSVII
ncbi:hypothetical protein [Winogradskyella sp.]|uniref:hypothetical protein n=1 Tax=Winogradskyella sp. TaxID=1883156 RepID=UPI0025E24E5D|nr:hypothetical protein [Winogradskyella sp.]